MRVLSATLAVYVDDGRAVGLDEENGNKDETRQSQSDQRPVHRSSGLSVRLDSRQLRTGRSRRRTVSVRRRRSHNRAAVGELTLVDVRE